MDASNERSKSLPARAVDSLTQRGTQREELCFDPPAACAIGYAPKAVFLIKQRLKHAPAEPPLRIRSVLPSLFLFLSR